MNDRYYLEVQFMDNDTTDIEVENALAYLMEFANRTQVTSEVLAEYGKIIMEHDRIGIDPLLLQKCLMFTYNRKAEKWLQSFSRFCVFLLR